MRVFLSIDIPNDIKIKLINLKKNLSQHSQDVKFTPIDNLHITVKFLSEQPDFAIRKIRNILNKQVSTAGSFIIHLNQCGVFHSLHNTRVLWVGENNSSFVKFAESINKKLNICRMQENKSFCHTTVGRIKKIGKTDILNIIKECKTFFKDQELIFSVASVSLYKSELLSKSAKYTKIDEFKFKGEIDG